MADVKMPTVAKTREVLHCHARVIARSGMRAIAIANIARDVVGIPSSFAITNIVIKYDETAQDRLWRVRMLIKDDVSDPDMVPESRDLLNVDLSNAAAGDADTIGIELRGCTRRIHIGEFAEGERVLCFVLETALKRDSSLATNVDVLANPLELRTISFDCIECTATMRKRR